MRIFVLGAGATGSLLAQLLQRQGHTVWCGDRDLERAQRFLGKQSSIRITEVNARNLHGIVRAARACIATADAAWASVLRSWKNSASGTRSAPRMWFWLPRTK